MRPIDVELRSEGVREWNYTLSFGRPGGLSDRELLAAAQWACEKKVWDRCINTSERTRDVVDVAQRYPTPFKHEVVRAAHEVGLDPALMYGLIRQESRFITSARSGVGAAGLMQIMPGTARWTARKLGLRLSSADLHDAGSNLRLGAGYLRLLLDNFGGSQALATAAYNAGPNRPRRWREGAPTETAAWVENIPFSETRDYVKKVLANASVYSVILQHGEDRDSPPVVSLAPRLGTGVAPLAKGQSEGEADLP
jgi:soluble lytic murein transglycosylase